MIAFVVGRVGFLDRQRHRHWLRICRRFSFIAEKVRISLVTCKATMEGRKKDKGAGKILLFLPLEVIREFLFGRNFTSEQYLWEKMSLRGDFRA
jgi:hypothetical protein